MNPHLLIWMQFLLCVLVIGGSGVRLIRYGDAIAALTGMSRSWAGLIMVATVTSLPELVTGLSAVTLAGAPDIAVGDALGSCVFNLAILALLDIFYRKGDLYAVARRGHRWSAGLGAVLLAMVCLLLLLAARGMLPSMGYVSWGSLLIFASYLLVMRIIYQVEHGPSASGDAQPCPISLRSALTGYTLASVAIVAAGVWLPLIGVELAMLMGWSNSFVGTLFVAVATSVPELATTWGALRIGAIDMAIGNLLGSNLFDVLILALDDLAWRPGALFNDVSSAHAFSALSASVMSCAVVVALTLRPRRLWRIGSWASILLLALYLVNTLLQF